MKETASIYMEAGGDRVSELPENIIHRIMSFLSPAESARFSTLSKLLSSAYLSLPSLNFQFHHNCMSSKFYDDFDLVRNSLEKLRNLLETNFDSLSFEVYLVCTQSGKQKHDHDSVLIRRFNSVTELLENLVNFALNKKIAYLNLYCDGYKYLQDWYFKNKSALKRLSNVVFSAETIKSMRLFGLILSAKDLILACPLIEDYHLESCYGLKRIHVSSCAKLIKKIIIDNCDGQERIHVASHKCLKFLELRRLEITDEWIRNHVSEFESLETLKLIECNKIKNLLAHNENLKCLELSKCNALENVDVVGSGLESFRLHVSSFHYQMHRSRVNINGCKLLKNLDLSNIFVTEKWIEDNLSGLTYLENLEFHDCDFKFNNPLKVYLENLKSMKFTNNHSNYTPWRSKVRI